MDVVMVEAGVARLQSNPDFVLRGLAELAHLRSLCTWGALLLAAVAAFGGLVRALRKAVRRLQQRTVRAAATAAGCGTGAISASIVPEPCSTDFSDDDDEDVCERRRSVSCSGSREWRKDYQHKQEDDEEEERHRLGCCVDDEQYESEQVRKRRDQQQDWGFGAGGWDSCFSCGRVVTAWDQDRGQTNAGAKVFFRETSGGGGAFSGFVPLIKSFGLEPPTLTLSCTDGLDLQLWDSRLRSCIPAALIPGPAAASLRRRLAVGVGASGGDHDKFVYLAERRRGGVVVDLRNTMGVLRQNDGADKTWWDANASYVYAGGASGCAAVNKEGMTDWTQRGRGSSRRWR